MSRRSSRRVEVPTKEDAIDGDDLIQTTSSVPSKQSKTKVPDSKKSSAKSKTKKKNDVELEETTPEPKKPATKGKRKAKVEEETKEGEEGEVKKITKKRKTKEEKEKDEIPLASRTDISTLARKIFIGAHVSASGGVHNAIKNSLHIGGNSFALFLKNQRQWNSAPLDLEVCEEFRAFCKEHNYDPAKHCLPHGSYLVNLAQAAPEKAEQALDCFVDDLKRCEKLGILLYNFHPGSSGSFPRDEAITRIAKSLNKAHAATSTVITVLENMAGAGNIIGSKWEDLRDIITQVDDKSRVGVCIDTCHTFAAGYDLRTPEAFKKTMDDFSKVVGVEYLKAVHLNDSKAPMSSNRDVHAKIGTGFLGLRAFHNVVNCHLFENLPMVLETPTGKEGNDAWAREIKLLEGLVGADVESQEFKEMEQRLQEEGAEERKKFQSQFDKKGRDKRGGDKKEQKSITSIFRPAAKGKKKVAEASGDEEDDDEEGCSH